MLVTGSDLHGCVFTAGCRSTYQQWNIKPFALHLFRHMLHLIE